MIPARAIGDLTETERREIELEENLRRKDLTAYERSRTLVDRAPLAAEIISTESVEKDSRGRKATYQAPKDKVAEYLGVGTTALVEAEQHVETADAYPFMQSPDWKQYQVLEAREHLNRIPEPDRETVAAIIQEPGVSPSKAIDVLRNMASMDAPARAEISQLYHSDDPREQSLAKTKAIALPPMPDPRVVRLQNIHREIRECIRLFPDDPVVPRHPSKNAATILLPNSVAEIGTSRYGRVSSPPSLRTKWHRTGPSVTIRDGRPATENRGVGGSRPPLGTSITRHRTETSADT